MHRLLSFTLPLCLVVIFSLGCEGSEGPAGPVGPQGEQGPAGPQGPVGNANVQVVTFTLTIAAFDNSTTVQNASRSMPELTNAVVSSGAVLAYTDLASGREAWTALPLTIATSGGSVATLTYAYSAGLFQNLILKNTAANLASVYAGSRIRVVIIPPATASALGRVDKKDYEAVRQALHLSR